jgi:hypothetical protein
MTGAENIFEETTYNQKSILCIDKYLYVVSIVSKKVSYGTRSR